MRLLLSLLALLALVAAAAYIPLRGRYDASADQVEADIAQAHFSFPAGYARDESTAVGGFTDRLAFVVVFPEFSSQANAEKSRELKTLSDRPKNRVFITVSAKDDTADPADRPTRLYARFLQGEAFAGPGGLVMRRFEQGSPYDLEQLYIAPPDGRDFFARCPNAQSKEAAAGKSCLSIFRVDGLDVELRFAPALLDKWETLNEGARNFVARIRNGKKNADSAR